MDWQWGLIICGMVVAPIIAGHHVAQLQRDPEYQARLREAQDAMQTLQIAFVHAIGAVWLLNRLAAALDWWDGKRGKA